MLQDDRDFMPPYQGQLNRGKTHIPIRTAGDSPENAVIEEAEAQPIPVVEQPEQIQAEAAEWQDKYTRLYAELENSKKRLARLYANQAEQDKEHLLRDMLPLADNLERALANASGVEAAGELRQGVALTLKAFVDALAKHGVRPIQAQGQPFDPELHEAAGAVRHPALPPGTVVRVEQKGYTVGDKLLRPARVLVAVG